MERFNERTVKTDVYSRVKMLPISEIERQVALNALSDADTIVNAFARAWNGIKGLVGGNSMNPSLRA